MSYSKEHKAKSKQRILQSATELFCRYGFDKVSIASLMKLAKMTHGAFYAHFESKEALYREAFQGALQRSRASKLIKGPMAVSHLRELVTGYLNLRDLGAQSTPGVESFLSNNIANENPEVKKLYEQSYFGLYRLLEKRLLALSKLKSSPLTFSPSLIPDKTRAILASMIGAIALAKSIEQDEEREAILAASQNHIFTILGLDEAQGAT